MPRGDKIQILKYPVYLPSIEEQRTIAENLGKIDEKIEVNRRMNETMERIGQTLFKHYFIDNPESKTWPHKKLSDFAEVVTGKGSTKSKLAEGGQYPLYGANGIMGTSDEYLFDEDLIMTGRVGTLGTVRISNEKLWASDNVLVIKPKKYFGYVYSNVKSLDFQSLNRGSTQPLVTQTDLKNQTIIEPPQEESEKFEVKFMAFLRQVQSNDAQNRTLISLRDSLLPRLISGKIKV
jgi:type I restriction enzyme S subunit